MPALPPMTKATSRISQSVIAIEDNTVRAIVVPMQKIGIHICQLVIHLIRSFTCFVMIGALFTFTSCFCQLPEGLFLLSEVSAKSYLLETNQSTQSTNNQFTQLPIPTDQHPPSIGRCGR
jgi:hypothetical protein